MTVTALPPALDSHTLLVAAVIVHDQTAGQVLLLQRGAGAKFAPLHWDLPSGKADKGESVTAAAARELEEETGLTLGAAPALAGLDYLGRAVTPPGNPVRFNARFFVVDEAEISGTLAGSGELEGLRWYGMAEALALDLARPTRAVITLLQEWMLLSPAERVGRVKTPAMKNRKLVME